MSLSESYYLAESLRRAVREHELRDRPLTVRPKPRTSWPARPLAQQRETAIHEAAHAVACRLLGYPATVWIDRGGPRIREEGGVVHGATTSPWKIANDDMRCDAVVVALAGPVAGAYYADARFGDLLDAIEEGGRRFGLGSDLPEALGILRRGGPGFLRTLHIEPYEPDDRLVAAPLLWRRALDNPGSSVGSCRGRGRGPRERWSGHRARVGPGH